MKRIDAYGTPDSANGGRRRFHHYLAARMDLRLDEKSCSAPDLSLGLKLEILLSNLGNNIVVRLVGEAELLFGL
jgi:hypothetical protein